MTRIEGGFVADVMQLKSGCKELCISEQDFVRICTLCPIYTTDFRACKRNGLNQKLM